MKTTFFRSSLRNSILMLLVILAACNNNKSAAQKQGTGKTPDIDLHTAVVTGNLDAVKLHIAAGSDLNIKDPFGGSSPLISAAVFGKTDIAKLLLTAGADINFQNNDGSTALHSAAFFCRPEIVKQLLAANADKTIKNKYGATAYDNVSGNFDEVKSLYDMMVSALGPMGLKLDYDFLKKTRPEIASVLK